ncbi:SDR family oxidoreductase [Williamsia sp. CHRR-6]|uniref:SDR family NAD(P)-dependent oxidoreductase n=1 Tax=Williamsia sp. CHRR-6 TaxID=2835871 RepID=UPI001BDB21CF|nr:SDR family oxidoreductase [Williamsia sp. CHRR-6]MBT0567193.1 SDR family oxidoreductase [Williamsia sp. CHRR-6]
MSTTRYALITGAAGGIGLEVARRMARRGYTVVAVERDIELATTAAERIGASSVPVACDLSDRDSTAALAERIRTEWADALEVAFLNAGIIIPGKVVDIAPEIIDKHLTIMLNSTTVLAQAAATVMVARGRGAIVATVSHGGILALPGSAPYSAAKAGLRAFLTALHHEVREAGVSVSALFPSAVDTPMLEHEAASGGSTLNFIGKISTIDDVADAFDEALRTGKPELHIPRGDGLFVALMQSFPRIARKLMPYAEQLGAKGRDRYLAQVAERDRLRPNVNA